MADHSHDHPSNPIPYYLGVFSLLLVFTGLTVFVARFDLEKIWGPLNIIVALTIALVKATAVVMIFMHVKWSSRLTQVIVVSGLFWLMIMLAFTLSDYYSRGGWPPGKIGP
jgi:cytochrome c oxidase subunit 4